MVPTEQPIPLELWLNIAVQQYGPAYARLIAWEADQSVAFDATTLARLTFVRWLVSTRRLEG